MSSLFATPGDWEDIRELPLAEIDPEEPRKSRSRRPSPARRVGVSFERLMRRADGTTFWCAGYGRPIDPSAPDRGVILTLVDVDARRRSEGRTAALCATILTWSSRICRCWYLCVRRKPGASSA
jgi:hypothetical protein